MLVSTYIKGVILLSTIPPDLACIWSGWSTTGSCECVKEGEGSWARTRNLTYSVPEENIDCGAEDINQNCNGDCEAKGW